MNGEEIYEKKVLVDWAFREKPIDTGKKLWFDEKKEIFNFLYILIFIRLIRIDIVTMVKKVYNQTSNIKILKIHKEKCQTFVHT